MRSPPAARVWLLACLAMAGCGADATSQSSWTATHPSTAVLSFDTTAPGLCAITVRYPDAAPAVINYLGSLYVQVGKAAHATPAAVDKVLGHSGDWEVDQRSDGQLRLLTPTDTYAYRAESAC